VTRRATSTSRDLRRKAEEHKDRLGALMVTYPSTYGVFEETIREVCQVVHEHGGQVYMDGANRTRRSVSRPKDIGADVCHLNLHKTFCIPTAAVAPEWTIGVASHLVPFLPAIRSPGWGRRNRRAVSAAPYGSPAILVIPWVYIAAHGRGGPAPRERGRDPQRELHGAPAGEPLPGRVHGPQRARRARVHRGRAAFKKTADIEVDDIAKRLMDYGFHAPTMSFPWRAP